MSQHGPITTVPSLPPVEERVAGTTFAATGAPTADDVHTCGERSALVDEHATSRSRSD